MLKKNIQQWLKLRQTVLTNYKKLCTENTNSETLQNFCQYLMDYLSMGHFKMFEKLAGHHETLPASSNKLDKNWLSSIKKTTHDLVDFNDKYTELKNVDTLSTDLSQIGTILADRMDWEDALIKAAVPAYGIRT